uniref:Galectin domain-containing protein n=1 Tax=Strix occidentalis caurina TaxID=311401 RepID=A0A8D0FPG1_STROC
MGLGDHRGVLGGGSSDLWARCVPPGATELCTPPPRGLSPGGALEILINAQERGYQVGLPPPPVGCHPPLWVLRPPAPRRGCPLPPKSVLRPPVPTYGCSDPQHPDMGAQHHRAPRCVTPLSPLSPQVAVNGQHALEFLHRLPLNSVQALDITGDVTLTCVTFTVSTPSPHPGVLPPSRDLQGGRVGTSRVDRPVGAPMGGLGAGCWVLDGCPRGRFHANLWSSSSGDVVLHVNPRLREAVLVRNTRRCGCWGPEERHVAGAMPFQRGQPFQLEIRPQSQAFALWVNGRHVCDYGHRLPPTSIDRLEVTGDVTLACVKC